MGRLLADFARDRLRARRAAALRESQERFDREWRDMSQRWLAGMEQFGASVEQFERTLGELFPDWHGDDWRRWTIAAAIPARTLTPLSTVMTEPDSIAR